MRRLMIEADKYRVALTLLLAVVLCVAAGRFAAAQDGGCDATCQAKRNAQDPLADIKAIMTDNTISFGTADGDTSYMFQVQPVYSIKTGHGFNFIARGLIPIVGAQTRARLPRQGPDPIGGSGINWGLSDIMLQGFFVPKTSGGLKFGFGPQVSLRTRTDNALGGPGWGAGFAAVVFGFAGDLSYGALVGHHWGQDDFSVTTIQPIVMYTTKLFDGLYVGYNNSITYNWNAGSGNRWQVPIGLTVGKTFVFEGGGALDVSVGGYRVAVRPAGGADWQLKFGISLFF